MLPEMFDNDHTKFFPERSSIESLGLVAKSVQEVVSNSVNKSAILDIVLMELEVRQNKFLSLLHFYWLLL